MRFVVNGFNALQFCKLRKNILQDSALVEQLDWSKGTATSHIFDRLRKKNVEGKGLQVPDFMLVAGDDREDEVVFDYAAKLASEGKVTGLTTVSIGKRNTRAMATLTSGTAGQ